MHDHEPGDSPPNEARLLSALRSRRPLIRGHRRAPSTLRVGLPKIEDPFLDLIVKFRLRHPNLRLELSLDENPDQLEFGDLDLCVRLEESEPVGGVVALRLPFKSHVVASPEFLVQAGAPASAKEVFASRWVVHRSPWSHLIEPWPCLLAPEAPAPLICECLGTCHRLALRGAGLALLPEFVTKLDVWDGRLVPVLPRLLSASGALLVLRSPGRPFHPLAALFLKFLQEELRIAGC